MTVDSLLRRVHDHLDAIRMAHALIGAAALAVHGVSRSTFDQDLLVVEPRALTAATWSGLAESIRVDIRPGDAEDPLAGVVRVSCDGDRDVDVIVGRHAWQREIIQRAPRLDTPAGSMPVASPEALVLLKLYAGGSQDLWDIQQLRDTVGAALDTAVDHELQALPRQMRELWWRLRG